MPNSDDAFQSPAHYFRVVVNDRAEFGVWPVGRRPPDGWRTTAFAGTRTSCQLHVAELAPAALRDAVDAPGSLPDLVDRVGRDSPDLPAVSDARTGLTYRQLARQIDKLAAELASCGVRDGVRVAVDLPWGVDFVVTLLAVLKTGACCVPVTASAPSQWRQAVLADAAPSLIINEPIRPVRVPGPGPTLRTPAAHRPDPHGPLPGASPHAGVLIYDHRGGTDHNDGRGTVGVIWDRRQLAALAGAERLRPTSRVAHQADEDASMVIVQLAWALHAGAELVALEDGSDVTPEGLGRRGITTALTDTAPAARYGIESNLWTAGGRHGRGRVERLLGFQETGIVSGAEHPAGGPGMPLPGVRFHILDDELVPVPPDSTGWLYVGGSAVARGYVGRPGLTMDRFLPDPLGGPGSRMFATGALVRRVGADRLAYATSPRSKREPGA